MIQGARYVHTNLIATDWRALASFYERVFGCTPVPPERDYAGADLEAATGIPGATLKGMHLRLPGGGEGDDGPTLEIYAYPEYAAVGSRAVNRPGFGHLAFEVDDVDAARAEVLANCGSAVGEVVRLETPDGRGVVWCYVTDPEGNALELQHWEPATPR